MCLQRQWLMAQETGPWSPVWVTQGLRLAGSAWPSVCCCEPRGEWTSNWSISIFLSVMQGKYNNFKKRYNSREQIFGLTWRPSASHIRVPGFHCGLWMAPDFTFLLIGTMGGSEDGSTNWVPVGHLWALEWIPGFSPNPSPASVSIWKMNLRMAVLFLKETNKIHTYSWYMLFGSIVWGYFHIWSKKHQRHVCFL